MALELETHIGLDLIAALGATTEAIHKHGRNLDRMARMAPRSITFRGGGAFPSSGNLLIIAEPKGPAQGRLWHVMKTSVGGAAGATTAPAGVAYSYIGTPGPSADVMGNWEDKTSSAFPVGAYYGRWQFTLHYPDQLYFVITGGTSTTQYNILGRVVDEPDYGVGQGFYDL